MDIKWCILISMLIHISNSMSNCPMECTCSWDEQNRLQTECLKPNLKGIPVQTMNNDTKVLIIHGAQHTISIGPIFGDFQKLQIIRITDSNVPAIGKNAFWGLQNLRILQLTKNNITQITDDNFRGQDGLHELDLSQNKIHRMPSGVFFHLKDLRKLNLAENSIEELVPRLFLMLSKLKHLDLSGNSLNELPPDVFRDISELKVLRCRRCNLQKINAQIYNLLTHLEELDLGDNQLKYLEKDEFIDVQRLKKIRLDGNQLSVVIDNLFMHQKNLQYLDLSRNLLAKVTNDAFTSLANLTYLDLSYNKLGKLEPDSVVPLKHLHSLNISGNIQMDLFDIGDTFQLIHGLSSLYIADMGPLPMGLLTPFTQLRALNLSGNHLDNISMVIINPVGGLELLDLSNNQLNGFGSDSFPNRLQRIKDVKLEYNPLICDRCHMGSLIDMAEKLSWKSIPTCFLPESLRGVLISDLNSRSLENCMEFIHDEGHDAASTSHNFLERGNLNALAFLFGIIFVLLAAIILISVVCYSRHRARYYTHEDKRNESALEKSLDTPAPIKGNQISFTFPQDDRVCTIDEIMIKSPIPAPPPLPSKKLQQRE